MTDIVERARADADALEKSEVFQGPLSAITSLRDSADTIERLRSGVDWSELEDVIWNAIQDSIDVDWTASVAATAVVEALKKEPGFGAGGVKVKELEWRDHSFKDEVLWIAHSPFDDYRVTKEDAEWPFVLRPFRTSQSNYQTLDEAKAAAESDYEQRILSALSAAPPPPVSGAGEWLPFPEDGTCPVDPDTKIYARIRGDNELGYWWRAGNLAAHAKCPDKHPRSYRYEYRLSATPESINAEMLEALKDLTIAQGDDPCRLDHHGYCQEHYLEPAGECCVAKARALIAKATAGKAAEPEAGR